MAPKKIILTGDRPTGPLHIGHYVGSLRQRVELQNKGDYDEMYVFIADNQALTDNIENPDKIRDNILEVALDYLSVGLDPNKISIFVQSQVPEMAELAFYLMDFVTVATLERNPTLKAEIKQKIWVKACLVVSSFILFLKPEILQPLMLHWFLLVKINHL